MKIVEALKKVYEAMGGSDSFSETDIATGIEQISEVATPAPAPEPELPEVTSDDNGDVLTVVDGAWAKAEPSGGSVPMEVVTFTIDDDSGDVTCDHTYSQLKDLSYADDGQNLPLLFVKIRYVWEEDDEQHESSTLYPCHVEISGSDVRVYYITGINTGSYAGYSGNVYLVTSDNEVTYDGFYPTNSLIVTVDNNDTLSKTFNEINNAFDAGVNVIVRVDGTGGRSEYIVTNTFNNGSNDYRVKVNSEDGWVTYKATSFNGYPVKV